MQISVIICTHNPRREYLQRTLDALRVQTLPKEHWELLLIDNASQEPLSSAWDLSWHPQARHVREEETGLTPARLRGIKESAGDLLVFVDDDNVLSPDYLKSALDLSEHRPDAGAWSGRIDPEFESPPDDWLKPCLPYLAIHPVEKEAWTDQILDWKAMPVGAGLCFRRAIGLRYVASCQEGGLRKMLDRKGSSLISGGDNDLALTAIACGYKIGLSPQLHMVHLIPKERLEKSYMLKLLEGCSVSNLMLQSLWTGPPPSDNRWRHLARWAKTWVTRRGFDREAALASLRGRRRFFRDFRNAYPK